MTPKGRSVKRVVVFASALSGLLVHIPIYWVTKPQKLHKFTLSR